jgi:tetratricopeptide (TPR) repeat protein
MRLRQEQIVFVAGVAILALLTWGVFSGSDRRSRRPSSSEIELTHQYAPDLALVLPDREAGPALVRALFAPPRDTRPLPPLELVEPPRAPFTSLLPPTALGPMPRVFGTLLRREVPKSFVADLFDDVGAIAADQDDAFFDAEEEPESDRSLIGALRDMETPEDPFLDETPEERTARLEGYKKRYDWIQRTTGGLIFGRIENSDRFGLGVDSGRASEAVLFVEIDPVTGRETYETTGALAMPYNRGLILEFGFAGIPANEIELRAMELGETLTRGSFEAALLFADECVRDRLEAPQALEVAERYYRLCAAFDPDDPAPRLGLARTFEAGFRFEEAFDEYRALLEAFPLRAEVLARLAGLEERFLMRERAGARFREAVALDRSSWEARWGLGRFLVHGGEHDEAIEHLAQASRLVPGAPELLELRLDLRVDHGAALFAAGRLAEAKRVFEQTVRADGTQQRALAGLLVTTLLESPAAGGELELGDLPSLLTVDLDEGVGFELLLASGLERILAGDPAGARDQFLLAMEADPLRAQLPCDALSFLAEITGHEGEALGFTDLALEIDPADPWALYQRGRLLGRAGDYEGARASLLGALEVELDFEDALAELGDMAFRLGRFDDAERYLERAVSLEGDRAEVHALRGLNSLRIGSVTEARRSFERALELAPADPVARGGAAWCTYLAGDSTEALIQLADLIDSRRALSVDDPHTLWATAQIDRLQEHTAREEWGDVFNRKRLMNGWNADQGVGPEVGMDEGAVEVEGVFTQSGLTRVWREYMASLFVSLEADVWIEATAVRAGIFIARERPRRGENEVTHEASVTRHKDGSTQVRLVRSGLTPEIIDMEQPFPTGQWVRLRIERQGEGSETNVTLFLDGIPLVENARLAGIGQGSSPLLVGLLVEGEVGREARVKMDNVAVVYRVE